MLCKLLIYSDVIAQFLHRKTRESLGQGRDSEEEPISLLNELNILCGLERHEVG